MKKGTRLQVYDRGDHVMPGARGLVAAVLIRSLEDYRAGDPFAKVWISREGNPEDPFSFAWTCDVLTLDPGRVRRALRRLPPAPPSRPDLEVDDELDPEA